MGTHRLADAFALSVRSSLNLPADAPPRAVALALWGPRACVLARGTTSIVRDGATTSLRQDPSTPLHVRHWTLARSLAAFLVERDGSALPLSLVAASLLLPASAMAREHGEPPESIASRYVAPLGAVLLRVADLEQRPTALVMQSWSRVGGNARGTLPTDHATLRELAFGRVALLRLRRTHTPDGEIALRTG